MSRIKICIVDDEVITRMDIREMLSDAGYDVVGEGSSGLAAVELARKLRPDLTLLDVKMPRLDGIETAKIFSVERLGPVLLLTAFTDRNLINRAQNVGVMGYLVKPVREQDLLAAIPVAISRYRDIQTLKKQFAKLHEELERGRLVERAKGMIMAQYQMTESESHRWMQERSMRSRKNMTGVAYEILNSDYFPAREVGRVDYQSRRRDG